MSVSLHVCLSISLSVCLCVSVRLRARETLCVCFKLTGYSMSGWICSVQLLSAVFSGVVSFIVDFSVFYSQIHSPLAEKIDQTLKRSLQGASRSRGFKTQLINFINQVISYRQLMDNRLIVCIPNVGIHVAKEFPLAL